MTWVSVSPQAPEGLTQALQAVTETLGVLQTSLEVVKVEAQATALLVTSTESAAVTAANAAIQGVIATLNSALDAVLDDAGLFLLPIPLPKRGVARLSPYGGSNNPRSLQGSGNETGTNLIEYPVNSVLDRASPAEREVFESNDLLQQIVAPLDLIVGGNAHILKTISEALFDMGDANRPRFGDHDTFGYGLLVAGSSNISDVLSIASYFDRLIGGANNSNHVGASRGVSHIVPQGVRASPSGRNNYAIIEWDLAPASTVLGSYDSSSVLIDRYAIIRSTDLRARSARQVMDLFGSTSLTPGLTGVYGAKVLTVSAYDGVVTRYVDSESLDPAKTYYYHVAFSTRVNPGVMPEPIPAELLREGVDDDQAQPQNIGFGPLSSAVQFRRPTHREDYQGRGLSQAPDFVRTPSVVAIVPPLNGLIDFVQTYLTSLERRVTNAATRNQQIINFLDQEIRKYSLSIDQITAKLTQLQGFFTAPESAVGTYTTFRTGTGTATSFIADLAQALSDLTDESAPPFTNGDEFTAGVLVLAVGPDPAPILAAFELLKALFTPGSHADPALAGIRSINTQLAAAEADLVNRITGGTNAIANPSITFNANMTPRAPGQGDATCDP